MTITKQNSGELKARVYNCLNKLSDRDTLSMATYELENIAKQLPSDSFAPFLNCLSATDSSDKSPVRRQCVRLLGILSAAHGDALSPHISRMISAVLRRLRDPDSAVRSACVDAVSSIAAHVNSPPISVILKPFVDALFQEQDLNSQIGASVCLSAAVESAPEVDAAELRRILPRVLKLVKSEGFKAKSSLLLFIGSIANVGCVKSKSSMSCLVSTAIEFLSSEDWAARKAAAEILEKVVTAERGLVAEFKASCVAALESRRFDRIKLVRETMNRALEMWKDFPELSQESSSPKDSSSSGQSPALVSCSPSSSGLGTPQPRKLVPIRSPASSSPSTSSSQKTINLQIEDMKQCPSSSSKLNLRRNFRSRVVPFNCNETVNTADGNAAIKEDIGNQKELDEIFQIRKQLLQIENQQASLLELLQKFMGSSQKGMGYLEKRVDGLEKVLNEMSQDLGISTRRISSTDYSTGNTCCMIPGAEFLSPKFWKNQSVNSHFKSQSLHGMMMAHKDTDC
ncbi:hypothetical protein ACJIZ3_025594 [Penstemon smallii]|uniref:TORTIFOLIA1/SINE1-2 N-terminal domain-containing protein n=1 Tax=Penstemon smallii TaxID=265156 RepID=A0ABD3TXK5_9LAMI